MRTLGGVVSVVLLLAVSPLWAQPEDYEIYGGYRLGRFRIGVPPTRLVQALGREDGSAPWQTAWGRGRTLSWPRKGLNAKVCGRPETVVEVNAYIPPAPGAAPDALLVEIGQYQIMRQFGIRTPAFLMPEYFGEPDTRRVVPSQLGGTRTEMYWYAHGLHMEAEFGEVVEIGVVVIPPGCP